MPIGSASIDREIRRPCLERQPGGCVRAGQGALVGGAWVAAVLAAARAAAVWGGAWAGCVLGASDPVLKPRLWQGLITQAPVLHYHPCP